MLVRPLRKDIEERIRPRVVAEAEDMGMLQVLGQQGLGLFTVERKLRHPAAVAISSSARAELFA